MVKMPLKETTKLMPLILDLGVVLCSQMFFKPQPSIKISGLGCEQCDRYVHMFYEALHLIRI
jgi:hypothetical protein